MTNKKTAYYIKLRLYVFGYHFQSGMVVANPNPTSSGHVRQVQPYCTKL